MQTRRDFLKIMAMLSGAAGAAGVLPESIQRAFAIEPTPGSTYLDAEHIVILMQENRSFDHTLGTLQGVRGFNDPRALQLANGNSVFVQTDAAGQSYAPWRLDIRDTRITWMGSIPHSRNSQVDAWNEGQHDQWLEAKRSGNHEYAALPLTMGYYTREDLPFYYALADAFTVCDQNYCSVMTSTTPNRSCFWTGTVRDAQRTDSRVYMRNDQIIKGGMTWKTYPERLHDAGISWKLYQNELTLSGGLNPEEDAWLSNFGTNLLENFAAYNVEAYPGSVSAMQHQIDSLQHQIDQLEQKLSAQGADKDPELVERLASRKQRVEEVKKALSKSGEDRYRKLDERQRALYHAAFVTNAGDPHYRSLEELTFEDADKTQTMKVPKGDILYQFRKDVDEGKLPTISWLSAPARFSDHPSSPWFGAWYVSEVMNILTKNPEVWKKTIFILTYDENDGYFDHGPSYVAADPKRPETGGASSGIDTGLEYTYMEDEIVQGVSGKEARSGPIGMGFRVPMIIASPWTRGGWVNSQLFDHTSCLMFLEDFVQKKYGKTVREENISAWRRAITGDLTSVFRSHNETASTLDYLKRDPFVMSIQKARYKAIPSDYKLLTEEHIEQINRTPLKSALMAHQELGIRPSCALPYELYVDGALTPDRNGFQLRMTAGTAVHGKRSSGAPFNVYLRNTQKSTKNSSGMVVATYVVKPGDTLQKIIPLSVFDEGKYVIDVHAPNGFYRSFAGNSHQQGIDAQLVYEEREKALTGNVIVKLRNHDNEAHKVSITDNSYKEGSVPRTIAPGQESTVLLDLKHSHGWYDVSVVTNDSKELARFAGRVETGHSSFSDPLMGAIV